MAAATTPMADRVKTPLPEGEGGPHRESGGRVRGSPLSASSPIPGAVRTSHHSIPSPSPTASGPLPLPLGEGVWLLRLLTWLSPAFPVGAFGYSHGLERAIHDGLVADAATLEDWIDLLLTHGGAWNDAVLFNAALLAPPDALAGIAELAEALAPTQERHAETTHQGAAFLKALKAWPDARPALTGAPYPVAVGAACALAGIEALPGLTAYLHAFAAAQVSVALRAIPLGQTDGVAVLARLEPVILATAARAAGSTLEDLGSAAFAGDIASARHETQPVRLFLS